MVVPTGVGDTGLDMSLEIHTRCTCEHTEQSGGGLRHGGQLLCFGSLYCITLFDFHDNPARQNSFPRRTVGEKQRGQQSATVTPLLIPCAWSGSPGLKMWLDWFSDTQERVSWQWISPFYPAEWESIVTLRRHSAKSLTLLYWEIWKHFISINITHLQIDCKPSTYHQHHVHQHLLTLR